jgi:hypothetical protein
MIGSKLQKASTHPSPGGAVKRCNIFFSGAERNGLSYSTASQFFYNAATYLDSSHNTPFPNVIIFPASFLSSTFEMLALRIFFLARAKGD